MAHQQGNELMSQRMVTDILTSTGRLMGIVHLPGEAATGSCLVMLNAGLISRSGPQRIYIKAARELSAIGLTVLRVDLPGTGDSEAENDVVHFDKDRIDDVAHIVTFAKENLGASRIILMGLCAGARAAIKSAERNPVVDAVLAWSCPILTASEGMPKSPYEMAVGQSTQRRQANKDRILSALKEARFLTMSWWKKQLANPRERLRFVGRTFAGTSASSDMKISPFVRSLRNYLQSGRPIHLIYGERDRVPIMEFESEFAMECAQRSPLISVNVVTGGTHTFTSVDSQRYLIKLSVNWLKEQGFCELDKPRAAVSK